MVIIMVIFQKSEYLMLMFLENVLGLLTQKLTRFVLEIKNTFLISSHEVTTDNLIF